MSHPLPRGILWQVLGAGGVLPSCFPDSQQLLREFACSPQGCLACWENSVKGADSSDLKRLGTESASARGRCCERAKAKFCWTHSCLISWDLPLIGLLQRGVFADRDGEFSLLSSSLMVKTFESAEQTLQTLLFEFPLLTSSAVITKQLHLTPWNCYWFMPTQVRIRPADGQKCCFNPFLKFFLSPVDFGSHLRHRTSLSRSICMAWCHSGLHGTAQRFTPVAGLCQQRYC